MMFDGNRTATSLAKSSLELVSSQQESTPPSPRANLAYALSLSLPHTHTHILTFLFFNNRAEPPTPLELPTFVS